MDPFSAFSLACGVIQITSSGIKLVAKCKEVYENGSISQYEDLEKMTNELADLQVGLARPETADTELPGEQSLLDVAEKCTESAEQLVQKLGTLKIQGTPRKWEAVKKTIKALWEKGEIEVYWKKLESYRRALDTHILVDLRQRLDLVSLQQYDGFKNLDQTIQTLIRSLSEGLKSFDELTLQIQGESKQTRDSIGQDLQRHEQRRENEKYRESLLNGLWFPELHRRQETIAEAHKKTFEWVFDTSAQATSNWDSFTQWLEAGQNTYWIHGKAGAGKSTLMNFLCEDERTMKSLQVWSKSKDILVLNFFFWNAGGPMGKSVEGMLRSLLWQIITRHPDFTGIQDHLSHSSRPVWCGRRLRTTLQRVLQQTSCHLYLCLFLDGLDELDGDPDELIRLILEIVQNTKVKICLSSRAHHEFREAFGSSAQLQVQDLTTDDIQTFVSDKLQSTSQARSLASRNPLWLEKIRDDIVAKAEGVFLWASLAVKDQLRGIRKGDTSEELKARLASLPREIEEIYAKILNHIDKPYREAASRVLLIVSQNAGLSLVYFSLMCHTGLERMLESSDILTEQEVIMLSLSTRHTIELACADLLEVRARKVPQYNYQSKSYSWGNVPLHRRFRSPLVRFASQISESDVFTSEADRYVCVEVAHRTVTDFLRNPEQGGKFIEVNVTPGFDARDSYIKFLIAQAQLCGCVPRVERSHPEHIDFIMLEISRLEGISGLAQTRLCELADIAMHKIDRGHHDLRIHTSCDCEHRSCEERGCEIQGGPHRLCDHRDWNLGSHWCTRWGRRRHSPPFRDIPLSKTGSTSRASSQDSFHSAVSQRKTRELSTFVTSRPTNFLSFAGAHGNCFYLQHILDGRIPLMDPDNESNVLVCSMLRGHRPPHKGESHVAHCFKRGANPNAKTDLSKYNDTIWGAFLERMDEMYRQINKNSLYDDIEQQHNPNNPYSEILAQHAEDFVVNGADLHIVVKAEVYYHGGGPPWQFDVEMSALAVLQLRLKDQPQWPRIRDICLAKRAKFHYRCTELVLTSKSDSGPAREYFAPSKQESATLLDLVERSHEATKVHTQEEVTRQMSQFCNTLDREHRQSGIETSALEAFRNRIEDLCHRPKRFSSRRTVPKTRA